MKRRRSMVLFCRTGSAVRERSLTFSGVRRGRVNYHLLYFFHGPSIAILAHATSKESTIPAVEIDRAFERKTAYEQDTERYTRKGDLNDA